MNSSLALNLVKLKNKIIEENAFSLIELLTVVAIIGILALVAIPTFIIQKNKAQDSSARSVLDNSKKALFSGSNGDFTHYASSDEAATTMASYEGNYDFTTATISTQKSPSTEKVYVNVFLAGSNDNEATSSNEPATAVLSTISSSGKCISLTINTDNIETWSDDDTTCGSNSSSTDTNDNSSPNPSGPPGSPVITISGSSNNQTGDTTPTFNVAVTDGNTARCKIGSASFTNASGSGTELNFTSPSTLSLGTYKIYCFQIKPSGNYSATAKYNFEIISNDPYWDGTSLHFGSIAETWPYAQCVTQNINNAARYISLKQMAGDISTSSPFTPTINPGEELYINCFGMSDVAANFGQPGFTFGQIDLSGPQGGPHAYIEGGVPGWWINTYVPELIIGSGNLEYIYPYINSGNTFLNLIYQSDVTPMGSATDYVITPFICTTSDTNSCEQITGSTADYTVEGCLDWKTGNYELLTVNECRSTEGLTNDYTFEYGAQDNSPGSNPSLDGTFYAYPQLCLSLTNPAVQNYYFRWRITGINNRITSGPNSHSEYTTMEQPYLDNPSVEWCSG